MGSNPIWKNPKNFYRSVWTNLEARKMNSVFWNQEKLVYVEDPVSVSQQIVATNLF